MGKVCWNHEHVGIYYMKNIIRLSFGFFTLILRETSKKCFPRIIRQQKCGSEQVENHKNQITSPFTDLIVTILKLIIYICLCVYTTQLHVRSIALHCEFHYYISKLSLNFKMKLQNLNRVNFYTGNAQSHTYAMHASKNISPAAITWHI